MTTDRDIEEAARLRKALEKAATDLEQAGSALRRAGYLLCGRHAADCAAEVRAVLSTEER